MEINKKINNDTMVVNVAGRIDTNTAGQFESEVFGDIEKINDLKIDFKDVDYISSAGLRVLLALQKEMNKHGKMTICNVNEEVMEVFDITGFVDVLTIE